MVFDGFDKITLTPSGFSMDKPWAYAVEHTPLGASTSTVAFSGVVTDGSSSVEITITKAGTYVAGAGRDDYYASAQTHVAYKPAPGGGATLSTVTGVTLEHDGYTKLAANVSGTNLADGWGYTLYSSDAFDGTYAAVSSAMSTSVSQEFTFAAADEGKYFKVVAQGTDNARHVESNVIKFEKYITISPVMRYTFEEDARDVETATVGSNVVTSTDAKEGTNSGTFDGTENSTIQFNDYVIPDEYTISLWIKPITVAISGMFQINTDNSNSDHINYQDTHIVD